MANITQTITQFPPAPDSGSDTPQEFNLKANAFVAHQANDYVGEVNTWATQANALQVEVNTSANTATTKANEASTSASEASTSATNSQLRTWEAEAEAKTADSYATQPIGEDVILFQSNDDGTFTEVPQVGVRSALHYSNEADKVARTGDTMTGVLNMGDNAINGVNQCTAWVTLNKGVIKASYNIASATFSGNLVIINFSTPMSNTNYAISSTGKRQMADSNNAITISEDRNTNRATTSIKMATNDQGGVALNISIVERLNFTFFGGRNV